MIWDCQSTLATGGQGHRFFQSEIEDFAEKSYIYQKYGPSNEKMETEDPSVTSEDDDPHQMR